MRKLIFLSLFLLSASFAQTQLYFLPQEADDAKDRIVDSIKQANDSIDIAMYNFSYKKFAKALVKASKRGVEIRVYFDKSKVKKDDSIYEYLLDNGIKCKILDKKNHLKVALFDKKSAIFGSTNWTKDSFKENFELVYYTDEKPDIKRLKKLFKSLKNY